MSRKQDGEETKAGKGMHLKSSMQEFRGRQRKNESEKDSVCIATN